jgi:integrase
VLVRNRLAALDAPRIYRLESLAARPGVERCPDGFSASCAGDTPTEIRDHAMLLSIAVYGVRSGEVRHLCLEDIDWERETICIRRRSSARVSTIRSFTKSARRSFDTSARCGRSARCERSSSRVQPYRTLTAGGFGTMVTSVCIGWTCVCHATAPTRSGTPARRICWPKAFRSRRSPIISAMSL